MSVLSLLWLATLWAGVQAAPPLALDVRVFRGSTEVTRETNVTVFPSGARTGGRPAPLLATGERQVTLASGQYDLQLVQHQEGRVSGLAWTTLRLLVRYPGETERHLEVLNFDDAWGALQVRQHGSRSTGAARWSARLLRKDGSEAARGVAGEGYQVIVAPAGTYDVVIEHPEKPVRLRDVVVRANLTYVHAF